MNNSFRPCRPMPKGSPHRGLVIAACALLSLPTSLGAEACMAAVQSSSAAAAAGQASTPATAEGPVLTSSEIAQGAILLHFAHTEGGLHLEGRGRSAFEITGADHVWFAADAHVVNGVLVVSTSLVQQPTAVRYSPQSAKDKVLSNGAGLSARPFETPE